MPLLRPAAPADARAVAEAHVRAWQVAYRGLLPDDYLDAMRPEDRALRYTFDRTGADDPLTIVAIEDGSIVGFATTGPARDADLPPAGELYALYVHPDRWSTGAGRALVVDSRERLSQRWDTGVLWVLEGNEQAQRFYRRDGWVADGRSRHEEVYGVPADVVRFARPLP